MNQKLKDIFSVTLSLISFTIAVISLALDWGQKWWIVWICALYFIFIANLLMFSHFKHNVKTYKLCITLLVIGILVVVAYMVCYLNGWLKYFENADTIKNIILDSGMWGIIVFLLIQIFQVVISFIPSMVTTLVGVAIYGPLVASLVSTVGILLGSILSFFIGRIFGRKVVVWIAGEEQTKKYCDLLNKKGKFLLVLMFLFPVFPDDLLCLVAGITTMSFRFFFIASLITRPVSIFTTAYFGSGQLIPYSGWGLYVWPVIIILLIAVFVLCWKYQDNVEKYFVAKFSSISQKYNNKNKSNKNLNKDKIANNNVDKDKINKKDKENAKSMKGDK